MTQEHTRKQKKQLCVNLMYDVCVESSASMSFINFNSGFPSIGSVSNINNILQQPPGTGNSTPSNNDNIAKVSSTLSGGSTGSSGGGGGGPRLSRQDSLALPSLAPGRSISNISRGMSVFFVCFLCFCAFFDNFFFCYCEIAPDVRI